MSQNTKNTSEKRMTLRIVPQIVIPLFVLTAFSLLVYAVHPSRTYLPSVEVDSHFDLADKNKDGVVTKEEFQYYLELRQATALAKNTDARSASNDIKICPNSGLPCSGDGMCSGDGGGCCKNEGETRTSGGCCK